METTYLSGEKTTRNAIADAFQEKSVVEGDFGSRNRISLR